MPLLIENNVLAFISVDLIVMSFLDVLMRAAWPWVEARADFTYLCPLGKDSMLLSLR